jgi:hypothetical protein
MLSAHRPIRNLQRPTQIGSRTEDASREFRRLLNARHAEVRNENSELAARMAAYTMAARMQLSAPEVGDLASESISTHALYGTDHANPLLAAYGRNCLLARRLLERGVRYVNLYCASRASGVDGLLNWDAHKTLKLDYGRHCPIFDKPTAALISDLAQRGMLDDTLVLWTTEFGRMPPIRRVRQGAIIIPMVSLVGCSAREYRVEPVMGLPIPLGVAAKSIRPPYGIFMPPYCTCLVSITSGSPITTMGSTGD